MARRGAPPGGLWAPILVLSLLSLGAADDEGSVHLRGDGGYDDVLAQAEGLRAALGAELAGTEVAGVPMSARLLGSFVRACKMDIACAKPKVLKYLAYRRQHPHVYSNLTIPNEHMHNMVNGGIDMLEGKSCAGEKVAICINSLMDWDAGLHEVLQMQVYNHEMLFRHQDAQRNGIVIVQDMVGFSLSQMWKTVRSGGIHLTNIFPQHIARIIIVGEPRLFGLVWNAVKQILPHTLRDSVVMLGHDWARLPEAGAGEGCEGVVHDALQRHAQLRMARQGGRAGEGGGEL